MSDTQSIFEADGTDEVYCAIKDEINPRCQEAKIFVEALWKKAYSYIDPDILAELPIQFHQRASVLKQSKPVPILQSRFDCRVFQTIAWRQAT